MNGRRSDRWPIVDRAGDMEREQAIRLLDELPTATAREVYRQRWAKTLYEPPTIPAEPLYLGRGPSWWRALSRRVWGQR